MKKYLSLLIVLFICVNISLAQDDPTLLTINGNKISRSEFEYIFNKHNSQTSFEKKELSDYLDLFVNFKLKVYAAIAEGIDTTKAFRDELNGYRAHAAEAYLNDNNFNDSIVATIYEKMRSDGRLYQTRIKQIFFYLPQTTPLYDVKQAMMRMDSIYNVLNESNGDCFDELVANYSDDKRLMSIGNMQLPEDLDFFLSSIPIGGYSKPYSTPQGIHLVKVIDKGDLMTFDEVKKKFQDASVGNANLALGALKRIDDLKKQYDFRFNDAALKELSTKGQTAMDLFTIDGINYSGSMFNKFASAYPGSLKKQLNAFVARSLLNYENSFLESKYPDFKLLIQEYKDGMLLFEISNKKIWEPVSTDEVGLASYFNSHKSKYKWELPRYNGMIIGYNDKADFKRIKKAIKRTDKKLTDIQFKESLSQYLSDDKFNIEQGVYAVGDNQIIDHLIFKVAPPLLNPPFRFYYLHGVKQKGPADYTSVKGEVIADYQNFLEEQWVKSLRSGAKVEINQEVLKTVNNK